MTDSAPLRKIADSCNHLGRAGLVNIFFTLAGFGQMLFAAGQHGAANKISQYFVKCTCGGATWLIKLMMIWNCSQRVYFLFWQRCMFFDNVFEKMQRDFCVSLYWEDRVYVTILLGGTEVHNWWWKQGISARPMSGGWCREGQRLPPWPRATPYVWLFLLIYSRNLFVS